MNIEQNTQSTLNPAVLNNGLPTMEEILSESGFRKNGAKLWVRFCPHCGGNDRFHVFQNDTGEWHFICQRCGYHGDGVRYLQEQEQCSFQNACLICGCSEKIKFGYKGNTTWKPKITLPQIRYGESRLAEYSQAMAKELVIYACGNLDDPDCRDYLAKCHIRKETAEKFFFGWLPQTFYRSREKWQLPKNEKKDVKNPDNLYLPRGFVMPIINPIHGSDCSHIYAIEWRCLEKDTQRAKSDPFHVYGTHCEVTGSGYSYWCSGDDTTKPVFICEGIKDACLIWQESHGQVETMATMGSGKLPTKETIDYLKNCPLVILNYDADSAGYKGAKTWRQYGLENLHEVYVPELHLKNGKRIKDFDEFLTVGGNGEFWIKGVLADIQDGQSDETLNPAELNSDGAEISARQEQEQEPTAYSVTSEYERSQSEARELAELADPLKREITDFTDSKKEELTASEQRENSERTTSELREMTELTDPLKRDFGDFGDSKKEQRSPSEARENEICAKSVQREITVYNAPVMPYNEMKHKTLPCIFPLEFDAVLTATEATIGEWESMVYGLSKPLNRYGLADYKSICRQYCNLDGCRQCRFYRNTMPLLCGLYKRLFNVNYLQVMKS